MKKYLIAIFLLSSFVIFDAMAVSQCYCSRKCGPRDVMPDDTPTYSTVKLPSGEQQEICFCKPWDRDNYTKRACDKKGNQKFRSYCDEQATSKKTKKQKRSKKQYKEPMHLSY